MKTSTVLLAEMVFPGQSKAAHLFISNINDQVAKNKIKFTIKGSIPIIQEADTWPKEREFGQIRHHVRAYMHT